MKRLIFLLVIAAFCVSTAWAQVIITEVDPATGMVELHNTGDDAVDVSAMFLCNRPAYAPISSLEVSSGDTTIPGHGYLVVTWAAVVSTDAELGLYSEPSYGSAEALVDYIAWGSAGHGRESVAAEAGIWMAGSFLEVPAEGQSLSMSGMGDMMADDPAQNWSAGEPSFGEGSGGGM